MEFSLKNGSLLSDVVKPQNPAKESVKICKFSAHTRNKKGSKDLVKRYTLTHTRTCHCMVHLKRFLYSTNPNSEVHLQLDEDTKEDDAKVYYCVLCEEKFREHHLLIDHFRKHGERKQNRPLSPSKSQNKDRESNVIQCEAVECNEVFESISKAIEHKFRKHRYESTNYFCKDCGKLFPLKIALEQHIIVEHKQPPVPQNDEIKCLFLCKFCSVSFSTLAAVRFHENGAHQMQKRLQNIIVLPPASKKVKVNNQGEMTSLYYCHLCGNEYMLKYNLMKHLDMGHTIEEKSTMPADGIIKCRACEAVFYNDKAYNVHNIHHKPDDLYVTSEEQRQKVVNRVDQDFDINRVPKLSEKITSYIPKPILVKNLKRLVPSKSQNRKVYVNTNSVDATLNAQN